MTDPADVLAEAALAALLREGADLVFETEEALVAWAKSRLTELIDEMVAGAENS